MHSFKLIVLALIVVAFSPSLVNTQLDVLEGIGCALRPMILVRTAECTARLKTDIDSVEGEPGFLQTRAVCCTIRHLRDCLSDAIGDECGGRNGKAFDVVLKSAINGVSNLANDHTCDMYNDFAGAFLCLQDWLIVVIVLAAILVLAMCCVTVCCRRSRRSRRSDNFRLLDR